MGACRVTNHTAVVWFSMTGWLSDECRKLYWAVASWNLAKVIVTKGRVYVELLHFRLSTIKGYTARAGEGGKAQLIESLSKNEKRCRTMQGLRTQPSPGLRENNNNNSGNHSNNAYYYYLGHGV